TYGDARVLLVAGSVGTDDNRQASWQPRPQGGAAGVESSSREKLGDFYVYPIDGRTTVANAQQKQVSFLDVKGAPAGKTYVYRNGWLQAFEAAQSVDTVLRFSTSRSGGLGDALPAGTMRVYMRDARGLPQFIGERSLDHTAMGAAVELATGR